MSGHNNFTELELEPLPHRTTAIVTSTNRSQFKKEEKLNDDVDSFKCAVLVIAIILSIIRSTTIAYSLFIGIRHLQATGTEIDATALDALAVNALFNITANPNAYNAFNPTVTAVVHLLVSVVYTIYQINSFYTLCKRTQTDSTAASTNPETSENQSRACIPECLSVGISKLRAAITQLKTRWSAWIHVATQLLEFSIQCLSLVEYSRGRLFDHPLRGSR